MHDWTTLQLDLEETRNQLLHRLQILAGKAAEMPGFTPVSAVAGRSPYDDALLSLSLSAEERLILSLALAPHVQSGFFEACILQVFPQGGELPELGGVRGVHYRGMLPTGETAQFVLAGLDVPDRLRVQHLLMNGVLMCNSILSLEAVTNGEPAMSGRLILSAEWLAKLLTGHEESPRFGSAFPAQRTTTEMQWDDLVLNPTTKSQINDIVLWMQHHAAVLSDPVLRRRLKPGYRVLFFGPSGTGKTLTATLIGKQFRKEVYRIDLSQVVSKYIGETEKNLEKVFARAANKDWILFFDEADALFGKRTSVRDAHDRYANQEVSYLLQRVEDFPGLIILASNFKSNIDEAFLRRFHSVVYFPAPSPGERLKLWQKMMPQIFRAEPSVDLTFLAETYELNGAAIQNVVQDASLRSAGRNDGVLRQADLLDAIRKTFRKEERSIG